MIITTLRKIRAASACADGYRKLARRLGGVKAYGLDTPLPVTVVLDSNGLDDTLWVLAMVCGAEGHRLHHKFACDIAEHILPIFEEKYPDDMRPRIVIETKQKLLRGEATDEELAIAKLEVFDSVNVSIAKLEVFDSVNVAIASGAFAAAHATEVTIFAPGNFIAKIVAFIARAAAFYLDDNPVSAATAEMKWQIAHLREMLESTENSPLSP